MPRCIVQMCSNYSNIASIRGVRMHSFPSKLERIKLWLQAIPQLFQDIDTFALQILNAKTNPYRICSDHFTQECYVNMNCKMFLSKTAVPSIFSSVRPLPSKRLCNLKRRLEGVEVRDHGTTFDRCFGVKHKKVGTEPYLYQRDNYTSTDPQVQILHLQSMSGRLNSIAIADRPPVSTADKSSQCPEYGGSVEMDPWSPQHNHLFSSTSIKSQRQRSHKEPMGMEEASDTGMKGKKKKKDKNEEEEERGKKERMVNLTLEMIYLLTGEHYIPRKKSDDGGALHAPGSVIQKENNKNDKKILELMSNIIQLLTGEVAIRTHHVSIYFSLDEWDYIKGNKDIYEEGIKEEPQKLRPLDCEYEDKREITADLGGTLCYYNEPNKIGAEGADFCDKGNSINPEISPVEQPPPANGIKEESALWEEGNQSVCSINPLTEQIQGTDTPTPIMGYSLNNNLSANYVSNGIKEETASCEGGNHSDGCRDCPTEQIQGTDTPIPIMNMYNCHKHFSTKAGFLKHQKTHTGAKPFVRSGCEKLFVGHSDLTAHKRSRTGKKPFTCSECGNSFTDRSGLRTHQKYHRAGKPFSCSECGKCFTRRSGLTAHIRIHTGEKPFTCTECGKCFRSHGGLRVHKKFHIGAKPFSCSECGKCFTRRSGLNTHLRIHTGEKPFTCTECGKCFARRYVLTAHYQLHTGEKPA
ncbi:hypothetical protein XELAEV_18001441mg [Xenopus laevis]|nr:hypothetical protein XELAEV_18001441mg [Xenopus laevis]